MPPGPAPVSHAPTPPLRLLATVQVGGHGDALRVEAAIKRLAPPAKRQIAAGLRPWPLPSPALTA